MVTAPVVPHDTSSDRPAKPSDVGVFYPRAKRLVDVGLSVAAIIVLAPLLAMIAVAVRTSSSGPIIFRQKRLGLHGSTFVMYKFRSMTAPRLGSPDVPQITAAGDRRVTRIGRVLRRSKLDELPQLVNVIRGQMSLVGPRPEVERYARAYPDEYRRILSVLPGITDFATLEFRHEEEILARSSDPEQMYVREVLPAKMRLYDRYLRERSLRTDLSLLARTLLHVLT